MSVTTSAHRILKRSPGGNTEDALPAELWELIEQFRGEMMLTRRELRTVQHDLRKDIESLGTKLKFANIGLVPLAVFVVALVLAWVRRQRHKASATIKQS